MDRQQLTMEQALAFLETVEGKEGLPEEVRGRLKALF